MYVADRHASVEVRMLSGMSEDEQAGALKILRSMIRSLREES
ncbi:hypothetical protein [Microbacterium maritypicum]